MMPTWVAILGGVAALVGSAGIGGLLKVWLDHKRGKRHQTDSVALALVETLTARVDKLEKQQAIERDRCDDELRVVRHRIQGWKQLFYSLLHLFDMPAKQRADALNGVRSEMAALEAAEKAETGAMFGGRHVEPAE